MGLRLTQITIPGVALTLSKPLVICFVRKSCISFSVNKQIIIFKKKPGSGMLGQIRLRLGSG
jgi:hypothetical protein